MGEPGDHRESYNTADLTKVAGNLKLRHYLLAYGTADTHVKAQHSVMLARALVDQGVLFRQLVSNLLISFG